MSAELTVNKAGDTNIVLGQPRTCVRTVIDFTGENAEVLFDADIRCFDVRMRVGANARVRVGAESVLRGVFNVADDTRLDIGRRLICNWQVLIAAGEGASITIGDDCLFSDVTMYSSDLHSIIDLKDGRRVNVARPIVLENRVWLARRVMVLKGAHIGYGAGVGSGSVVSGRIPRNCIAAGAPAKILRSGVTWVRPKISMLERDELRRYLEDFERFEAVRGPF